MNTIRLPLYSLLQYWDTSFLRPLYENYVYSLMEMFLLIAVMKGSLACLNISETSEWWLENPTLNSRLESHDKRDSVFLCLLCPHPITVIESKFTLCFVNSAWNALSIFCKMLCSIPLFVLYTLVALQAHGIWMLESILENC